MSAPRSGARLGRARGAALVVALLLVALAALFSLVGMRADVGVLSGTAPSSVGRALSGLVYAGTWLGAVVAAPVLLLSVAIDVAIERLAARIGARRCAATEPSAPTKSGARERHEESGATADEPVHKGS